MSSLPLVTFRLTRTGTGVAQTILEDGSPHVIKADAHCRAVVNSETQEWRITARFYVMDSGIDCA
jgi:hypothetical protein